MADISIIMPLYNAERFLAEALESVLRQTYRNFELICVDDGSADSTMEILNRFRIKDDRIVVISNRTRVGAAISRNKGLKAAKGKYVLFLDGDDIFEEELLERTSETIEHYQVDIVLFEYMHTPSDEIYNKKVKEHSPYYVEKFCREPFSIHNCSLEDSSNWSSSPCDKLFRKSFLDDNHLEFQDLPSFNDIYFARMALFCAEKVICLDDDRVMVYARDHDGTSRISSDRDPMCAYYAIEKLIKEVKERNLMAECFEHLYHLMAGKFWYVLVYRKDERRNKRFYQFLHEEGIVNCIEYGKEFYDWINPYDKYIIENFQNEAYDSRWFEHMDTYFECLLKQRGQILCQWMKDKQQRDEKVIIWGIGRNGTRLLNYLNEYDIRIEAIVDTSEEKQGTRICGYEVLKPDEICRKVNYILAVGEPVYLYATKMTEGDNVQIINVIDLLAEESG